MRFESDPIDLTRLTTSSIKNESRKVDIGHFAKPLHSGSSFKDFFEGLPLILAGSEMRRAVDSFVAAHKEKKMSILAMGAHPIKVGLSPIIIQLLNKGVIKAVAMNGAGIIHDLEIAMAGKTSEDVDMQLESGGFGMSEETACVINSAIVEGVKRGWGIGKSLAKRILEANYPYAGASILASAEKLGAPVTVHVAIGTDVVHMHPTADGGAIGEGSHRDFRTLATLVSQLEGGVYFNLGSAVILPEVFLKALTVARNLGYPVRRFTAINMDFIRHYRPTVNVVERPTRLGGTGITLIGHHEIMFPLLAAAILEGISA